MTTIHVTVPALHGPRVMGAIRAAQRALGDKVTATETARAVTGVVVTLDIGPATSHDAAIAASTARLAAQRWVPASTAAVDDSTTIEIAPSQRPLEDALAALDFTPAPSCQHSCHDGKAPPATWVVSVFYGCCSAQDLSHTCDACIDACLRVVQGVTSSGAFACGRCSRQLAASSVAITNRRIT